MSAKYDCFISHASEDKNEFVDPLAKELLRMGVNVWYDKFSLSVGDSLSRSIDKGLAKSRYGVLVISKAFLSKPWPEYELQGLTAKEIGSEKVILPIWHNINREDVLAFSPTLADKYAISSNAYDINYIVRELVRTVRPDISDKLHRIEAYNEFLKSSEKKSVSISELKPHPTVRHETLNPSQLVRIRLIREALVEVYRPSLGEMILNFKKDLNVENEIFIWEAIAAAFTTYKAFLQPSPEEMQEVFGGFLMLSMGNTVNPSESLDSRRIAAMTAIWAHLGTELDFEDLANP